MTRQTAQSSQNLSLRDLRYGVEIETIGQTRQAVAVAIQSVVGGNVRYVGGTYDAWEVQAADFRTWKVMTDSSLSAERSRQAEVVSPILRYDDLKAFQEIVRTIRRAGAKVDASCGIHVHVDASAFDGRTLGNLAKLVYKQEPLILKALGVAERRLASYTKPIDPELIAKIERHRPRSKDDLSRLWYGYDCPAPRHYDSTRYHGLNLHNVWYRGTVEFRWFEATLHAGKVKAYVQFALALAAKALASRGASSQRRTLNPESARYDFRCFLLRLGFIGEEFATARQHLLAPLGGDSAFKRGRPMADAAETPSPSAT